MGAAQGRRRGSTSSEEGPASSGSGATGGGSVCGTPRRGLRKRAQSYMGQTAVPVIKNRVYVGSRLDGMAAKMKNPRKFTHVLTLESSGRFPDDGSRLQYLNEPLDDDGGDDLAAFIPKIAEFIEDGARNGKLLIHCTSGVNRGPAIAVWYLMAFQNFDFEEAFDLVCARRQGVNIHPNYLAQLRKLEGGMAAKRKGRRPSDDMPQSSPRIHLVSS